MATIIRTATLDDRAVLTDFGRRAFEETFASQNAPENMDAYLTAAFNAERQTEELATTIASRSSPNALVCWWDTRKYTEVTCLAASRRTTLWN